ncbi:MAG: radical SAM protein [Thermoplasmatales archaeon]|nr:radical SAM protein [Thermoplasmatales archaeon]
MEIYCKSALTKTKLPGIDYSLNPYIGCSFSCLYCYVPYLFKMKRDEWKNVKAKINMPNLLREEIRKKEKGIVGISSSTDAYQPYERKYEIARKCIELLSKYGWKIDILTKSDLIMRDIDIIKKSDAKVGVTITTFNEEVIREWEPFAPSPYRRIEAIKKFSDEGIFTYIFFGPVFPFIREEEIEYCIEEFINAGAKEVIVDSLHIKQGMASEIEKIFPKIDLQRYGEIFEKAKKFAKGKIEVTKAW